MQDTELLRYSRHILLDEIGIEGQARILAAHALVIGAGGLGSPAAMYLAAAGVGQITVTDHDTVDLTNLQRQIAHRTATVGAPKVASLQATLHDLKPLVSGAAIQFDGQISVYDSRQADAPCYACTFPPDATFEEVRCSTMGVFAPLVGIIGAMQAAEALKLLCGIGRGLNGRLLMLDGRAMEWTEIRLPRNPDCPVCASAHANG